MGTFSSLSNGMYNAVPTGSMESSNIVFTGNRQVELRREEVPDCPPDGLVARSLVSLISTGTECICYRGEMDQGTHWADWVRYPFYPGYSNVAQVEKVGVEVEGFEVGDRIFSNSNHRQHIAVKPPLVKIPAEISDEEAAFSKLATITQTGVRRAQVNMGVKAAVIGLGPLGQLLTQYLRVMGAEEVLAIDTVRSRLDIARAHGATHTFAGNAAGALPFVKEHTEGRLADVVFDATGRYAVFPQALKLVRRFGTLMLIGDSPHPSKQVLQDDLITRQITVRGSLDEHLPADQGEWTQARQIQLFYKYLAYKGMRVADLITARHSPAEAPQVYARLLTDREDTLGVIFDWSLLESQRGGD